MQVSRVRFWFPAVVISLSLVSSLLCQENAPLPVQKVVLYKNGIGYFEHLGSVRENAQVEITLPTRQLNDVLKSLTVLDLGNGRVSGITYDSPDPVEHQLEDSPIDLNAASNLADLLNQLRGTAVLLTMPSGPIQGKLVGAQWKNRSQGSPQVEQVVLVSILTDKGILEVAELEKAGGLQFLDLGLVSDLGRHLDILKSGHQKDVRRLSIRTEGTGERNLFVSYTAEAPIWKTTYRIVLENGKDTLLQGWAIVDNTTSMDWDAVDLSLVSGAPVSFVQDLARPIYGNRPVVAPPSGIQIRPELHEGTMTEAEDFAADAAIPQDSPARRKMARSMAGEAFAAMAAPSPAMEMAPSSPGMAMGDVMERAVVVGAEGAKVGDHFEYRMRGKVTIGKNQSALLPILQNRIRSEKVSVFSEAKGLKNPRLAIWLTNDTTSTLDGGAFSIIDSNSFAGEGLLDTVQPNERRLLSYALDLAVEVSARADHEQRSVERLIIRQGVIRFIRKMVEKRTYTIRNNDDRDRAVLIEHPLRSDWKLSSALKPEESSANHYRFRVAVPANSTVPFVVSEEKPSENYYQLGSISRDTIQLWLRDSIIDPATERALQPLVEKRAQISTLSEAMATLEQEEARIFNDQERLRENLNRMGQTPDEARLRQRYVSQLEQQENRLADLRREKENLLSQLQEAQAELDNMLANLQIDKTL